MNVFILNAGRSGSTTFARACGHITNYTAGHETRIDRFGADRFDYPKNHIEVDNRLAWLLGRLERVCTRDTVFVHLKRNRAKTVKSFAQRCTKGIIRAYAQDIIVSPLKGVAWRQWVRGDAHRVAEDYYSTVECNIDLFLRDKIHVLEMHLGIIEDQFPEFWELIGAEGDMDAAIKEFDRYYNAGKVRKREARLQGRPLGDID